MLKPWETKKKTDPAVVMKLTDLSRWYCTDLSDIDEQSKRELSKRLNSKEIDQAEVLKKQRIDKELYNNEILRKIASSHNYQEPLTNKSFNKSMTE
jgi:hypothetical protein